ncbi:hypothetical protein SDC9_113865 [bioreactor metagenome]|uniref:Uncharacterized protein n=1 Tax=bioreactor metagenome TaxID=1076179 RepID=A0A645BQS7_9ZZZZ
MNRRIVIAAYDGLMNRLIKLLCPGLPIVHSPIDAREVVHNVSATKEQHTFVPKYAKFLADCIMLGRGKHRVDAQLHNRNIRLWKHAV